MSYVLENQSEGHRLERQSQSPEYDVSGELAWLTLDGSPTVVELGCGTGVAIRHLAARFPKLRGLGFDLSPERVLEAEGLKGNLPVRFQSMNLEDFDPPTDLGAELAQTRLVLARYVLHHLPESLVLETLRKVREQFALGTRMVVIEIDGYLANLRPVNAQTAREHALFLAACPVHFNAGSLLPHWARMTGWHAVQRHRQQLAHTAESRAREATQTFERLSNAMTLIRKIHPNEESARGYIERVVEEFQTLEAHPEYSKVVWELIPA